MTLASIVITCYTHTANNIVNILDTSVRQSIQLFDSIQNVQFKMDMCRCQRRKFLRWKCDTVSAEARTPAPDEELTQLSVHNILTQ